MNCQEFRRDIEDELLSDPETAVERLRMHLADCDQMTCRQFLEETLTLEQAIRVWRPQLPQVDVTDAVLSRWASESSVATAETEPVRPVEPARQQRTLSAPAPPASTSRAWPVVLAVALLLMMTLPLLVPDRSDNSGHLAGGSVPVLPTGDGTGSLSTATAPAVQPHQEVVRERSIAYYNAARQATRVVTDVVVLVLPDDDPTSQFEDPTQVPEWVGQWEQQIEPLKLQFDSAVRSLMNVLPEPMPAT